MREDFHMAIRNVVEKFHSLKEKPFRIISHLDADGITSASILIKAFKREDVRFSVSIVKGLTINVLEELAMEDYKNYVFLDLGSGQATDVHRILHDRVVIILDHHKPDSLKLEDVNENFFYINPVFYGFDGSREICGAGVTYLFCKELNKENKDLAHLAIVGAVGETQANGGFIGLNTEILKEAIESGKLEVKTGLRMFGMQTRPIHKVLEYSTDPYIPGVTGSEEGAVKFLMELDIKVKEDNNWRKLVNLSEDEMKRLVAGIILRRMGSEDNPEDVLGSIYILEDEIGESSTKDAKEFATLLNACGRLGKPSFGLGVCLGDKGLKEKAEELLNTYKRELVKGLNWFHDNRKTDFIIEGEGYVVINAEGNVRETLIGTLASIISKSNTYKEGTIILSLAHTLDDFIKVSIRICGFKLPDIDLRLIIKEINEAIGCNSFGGHKYAAGCIIPVEKEEEFIKHAQDVLERSVLKV